MLKKTKIRIENIRSENDKALIETEIDVLDGVKDINVNEKTGEVLMEFDDQKISLGKLLKIINDLDFQISENSKENFPVNGEHTYFVKGMHCASCEVLIEKRMLAIKGVKSVEASTEKGKVLVVYQNQRPKINELNKIFARENYLFFDYPVKTTEQSAEKNSFFSIIGTALLIIFAFFILQKIGLSDLINVNSSSSLPTLFLLGLVAGASSCAALVGGLILSMSKQWLGIYSEKNSTLEKLQPHFMFNIGRVISYAVLGGILGFIGGKLKISLTFTSVLAIAVSIMMFFLALQMLGVKRFRKFQFTMPKFVTRYVADETNFQGKYMPFVMGALTFFLPCGFTITAQGLALISGGAIQGSLIMFFFALGTLPSLLAIGLSAVKFSQKPHLAAKFSRIAGMLVLFFSLYTANAQLAVLGAPNFNDLKLNLASNQSNSTNNSSEEGLPPIVDGKQILKMNASSSGYSPNYLKVRAGVPVKWEVTDVGTSGCTNAIISRGLFSDQISLTRGQTSIKEFTPSKAGKYKFSCWMGMVQGIIEVVDSKKLGKNSVATVQAQDSNNDGVIPSGAQGCGGGNGGGCGGCGGGSKVN